MSKQSDMADILTRLSNLEDAVFGDRNDLAVGRLSRRKPYTLAELSKGKKFENGQQKIAFIVGYYEILQANQEIRVGLIRQGWREGKFDGSYNNKFIHRAIKDGLIRDLNDGRYDLSQTGEKYFESKSKE